MESFRPCPRRSRRTPRPTRRPRPPRPPPAPGALRQPAPPGTPQPPASHDFRLRARLRLRRRRVSGILLSLRSFLARSRIIRFRRLLARSASASATLVAFLDGGLGLGRALGVDRLRLLPGSRDRRRDQLLVDAPAPLGDPGRLADPAPQVVELGPAHVAAGGDLEFLDLGRMQWERPLDADAEGLLADGEGLSRARALALEDDSLEDLGASAAALDHLEVDAHAIARVEGGKSLPQLAPLDAVDHAAHCSSFCRACEKKPPDPYRAPRGCGMVPTPGRVRTARRGRGSARPATRAPARGRRRPGPRAPPSRDRTRAGCSAGTRACPRGPG